MKAVWGAHAPSRVVVGAPADHIFASSPLPLVRGKAVGEGANCDTRGACAPRKISWDYITARWRRNKLRAARFAGCLAVRRQPQSGVERCHPPPLI